MKRILTLALGLTLFSLRTMGQAEENSIYIVDSVKVIQDPEEGDELHEADMADLTVIRNKDTLRLIGLEKFNAAFIIFTKEYRKRPEEIRNIPSLGQMELKNGIWSYRGVVYSGKFLDYYFSGRKKGEGTLLNGKAEGLRTTFYQNGKPEWERHYKEAVLDGMEKKYYEDGSLKQQGAYVNGNRYGPWELYYPNGQLSQRVTFEQGKMTGETTQYYSNGLLMAVTQVKNGELIPDKRSEKVYQAIEKAQEYTQNEDSKNAIKQLSRAIELDSTFVRAYFARGTVKLNDFQFDQAIMDFDKALALEPYLTEAHTNRAFARIRKYQFASGRKLSESDGTTVLASKDNPGIPPSELALICNDLHQATFLGDKSKMTLEAVKEFCTPKSGQ